MLTAPSVAAAAAPPLATPLRQAPGTAPPVVHLWPAPRRTQSLRASNRTGSANSPRALLHPPPPNPLPAAAAACTHGAAGRGRRTQPQALSCRAAAPLASGVNAPNTLFGSGCGIRERTAALSCQAAASPGSSGVGHDGCLPDPLGPMGRRQGIRPVSPLRPHSAEVSAGGGRGGPSGRKGFLALAPPALRARGPVAAPATAATTAAAAMGTSSAGVAPEILCIAEGLPIRECLEEVLLGLDRSSGLVLQAPPGAGKTTVVPLALLRHAPEYLREGQRILVLEPRRVAAKGAARRMASSLGEPVGGTVGYRVRLDSRVSSSTRIEVVTEGILLRRLQHDPELAGVGAVVFDEFHERNLDADVALALCLDVQRLARPDLRLVVMSATLGGGLGDRVRHLMMAAAAGLDDNDGGGGGGGQDPASSSPLPSSGLAAGAGAEGGGDAAAAEGVPLVLSEGRSYPVRTVYLGRPDVTERGSLERAVADAVVRALREGAGRADDDKAASSPPEGGDVLAFLPGVGEIRRVERLLEEDGTARKYGVRVLQLHGNMAPDEQDEVLRPPPGGAAARRRQRRVILATPIAESSVTIDGVTAVVDSGLRRAPRYDPATAINRLDTIFISDASAEQRRGRAGRTAPGRCYRLWSDRDALPPVSEPEILTADLAPTALEVALWGSPDGSGLPWLDPPPRGLMQAGRELLQDLGALEPTTGRPTGHGRVLARLGVHPRWGHAVLRGEALGCVELAAVVATMLGQERDVLRGAGGSAGPAGRSADITLRLEALARNDPCLDRAAASRILQGAKSMAAMAAATVAAAARRAAAPAATGLSSLPSYGSGDEDEDAELAAAIAAAGAADGEDEDEGLGPLLSADASQDEAGPYVDVSTNSDGPTFAASSRDALSSPSFASSSSVASASGSSPKRTKPVAFDSAWRDQMYREGLVGALVAAAYPDRIAERRDRSNKRAAFTLASGQVVNLPTEDDPLGQCEYLAVAEIGGVGPASGAWRRDSGGSNDTVRSAAGLTGLAIERYLKDMIQNRDVVFWASSTRAVLSRRQKRLGCLVLSEKTVPTTDVAALPAVLQGFKELGGIRGMGLSRDLESWRQRVIWLRAQATSSSSSSAAAASLSPAAQRLASLPDLSDLGLLATARTWLGPHLAGVRSRSDLLKLDWGAIMKSLVPWQLQQLVEAEAPSHLQLPTGTRTLVDYSGDTPLVRCKLQEVFGLPEAPRLAGGRVPLVLELLSPAGRPAAVTSDLASFWRTSYLEVRRELRGRYPRHVWPEDPLQAEATRLTKRQLAAAEAAAAAAASSSSAPTSGAGGKGGDGSSGGGKKKAGAGGGKK